MLGFLHHVEPAFFWRIFCAIFAQRLWDLRRDATSGDSQRGSTNWWSFYFNMLSEWFSQLVKN